MRAVFRVMSIQTQLSGAYRFAALQHRYIVSEVIVLALANAVVGIDETPSKRNFSSMRQASAHSCRAHALPSYHIDAPKSAGYPYKAWCETIFNQCYFHHEQSGACYSTDSGHHGLPWTDIDFDELTTMIKSKKIQLFDVREPDEVKETGMMPGAVNIRLGEIPTALSMDPDEFQKKYKVEMPDKADRDIVFSCRGGRRSRIALGAAHEAGFNRARHYIGGWEEYAAKRRED